jgi:hypothetical protein
MRIPSVTTHVASMDTKVGSLKRATARAADLSLASTVMVLSERPVRQQRRKLSSADVNAFDPKNGFMVTTDPLHVREVDLEVWTNCRWRDGLSRLCPWGELYRSRVPPLMSASKVNDWMLAGYLLSTQPMRRLANGSLFSVNWVILGLDGRRSATYGNRAPVLAVAKLLPSKLRIHRRKTTHCFYPPLERSAPATSYASVPVSGGEPSIVTGGNKTPASTNAFKSPALG